jgi:hypothetical protein
MGAAHEHGLLVPLIAGRIKVITDTVTAAPGSRSRNADGPAIPGPAADAYCATSARSTPRTRASADPASGPTPNSRAGRSSARSAAAPRRATELVQALLALIHLG